MLLALLAIYWPEFSGKVISNNQEIKLGMERNKRRELPFKESKEKQI